LTVADDKKHTLVGQNYTTPDLVAKVTGKDEEERLSWQ
jgi:hypothetical protein